MQNLDHMLYLGAFLFAVGIAVIVVKRNAIMVLLGLELLLNASNVNLVVFNRIHAGRIDGQMFSLFVIIVAVCEAAVGLAIVLRVYQYYKTSVPDEVSELKD
ncbi:NADH-quinone oxidoreductase subunit NuoK [Pseudochryseolinea flava]|uniref:NADH-quinone oxidoreductase subunit K n=1 Tax=Pseudochryseolinea flava TaxID=2059302 RepID=A0A364XZJ9_9BACT|nr:NADH-quinone oxidoreductase subunit NuoK [Pseudochryseolinea flava]RAV99814.1 NADH-quinone oxidoreductase subunit NuoK [Pseudochryseolinea flava]